VTPTQPGSRARYLLWYWAPVVVFMAVIFVGSSISKLPDIPGGLSDKTAHGAEYAVLGLLLARGLAGPRRLSISLPYVIAAVVLASLYGVADEWHQRFVPGRDFDVRDVMADLAGASASTMALWAWGIIRRYTERRGKPRLSR
jgi:VanZ family protein